MKSIGKTMKIAAQHNTSEKEALAHLLTNYRDTPHSAIGVTPNDMFFRDSPQTIFPRRNISEQQIQNARSRDASIKNARQEKINLGKYRQHAHFQVGDTVLIRNFNKTSKFHPYFQYLPLLVTDVHNDGRCLTLQRIADGKVYQRHPDDVKLYKGRVETPQQTISAVPREEQCALQLQEQLIWDMYRDQGDVDFTFSTPEPVAPRPARQRNPNTRYFNDNMVNTLAH